MKCMICDRELNVPGDVRSLDCGGDCLECMAECGDVDCIAALEEAGLTVPPQAAAPQSPEEEAS